MKQRGGKAAQEELPSARPDQDPMVALQAPLDEARLFANPLPAAQTSHHRLPGMRHHSHQLARIAPEGSRPAAQHRSERAALHVSQELLAAEVPELGLT